MKNQTVERCARLLFSGLFFLFMTMPLSRANANARYFITAYPGNTYSHLKTTVSGLRKLGHTMHEVVTEFCAPSYPFVYLYAVVDAEEHLYNLYVPGFDSVIQVTGLIGYLLSHQPGHIPPADQLMWLENGPPFPTPNGMPSLPVFIMPESYVSLELTISVAGVQTSYEPESGYSLTQCQILLDSHYQLVQFVSGQASITQTGDYSSVFDPPTCPSPDIPSSTPSSTPSLDIMFGDFANLDFSEPTGAIQFLFDPADTSNFCNTHSVQQLQTENSEGVSDDEISQMSDPEEDEEYNNVSGDEYRYARHYQNHRRDDDDEGASGASSAGASTSGRHTSTSPCTERNWQSGKERQSGNSNYSKQQHQAILHDFSPVATRPLIAMLLSELLQKAAPFLLKVFSKGFVQRHLSGSIPGLTH